MKPTTELCHSATGLIYRLRRSPAHGQPRAALIVMVHGLSGDENAMWIFDHALPRSGTVVAPRALFASELGGHRWARSVVRDDLDDVDFLEALEVLPRFLNEVIALYEIDPQRVIVMGFSQGAALSYALSLAQPELLRGVIALAGFLPANLPAQSQNALPRYLIIHGTRDEAVPVDRARAARLELEKRGVVVEYHEHHVGHKISAQGMKEIARWLAATLQEF
jgi:phospholipase/carboxylesterase